MRLKSQSAPLTSLCAGPVGSRTEKEAADLTEAILQASPFAEGQSSFETGLSAQGGEEFNVSSAISVPFESTDREASRLPVVAAEASILPMVVGVEERTTSDFSQEAGVSSPRYPGSRLEWLAKLEKVTTMCEMGIALAWGMKMGYLHELNLNAGPSRPPEKQRSGELFPLSVQIPDGINLDGNDQTADQRFSLAVRCWVALCCGAANVLYRAPRQGIGRRLGKVHVAMVADMEGKISRFLEGETPADVSFEEAVADLRSKRISYSGEEVAQPYPLSASQIIKSLPPKGHGGSISVEPFLSGRSKYLLLNPLESMLDESERGSAPTTAKVHIQKGEELSVFNLLEDRGVTTWVEESVAFRDKRGVYLSGLFGVVKPNKFTEQGEPVLRVITNLIPVNGLFDVLRGDINYLPSATGWLPLVVDAGEQITMNQADMASAFYLFAVPEAWRPFFCLNFLVNGAKINKDPAKMFRPAIRVLPMGWASSVGIMQQVSREILLQNGLPPELEFRKTGPVPSWFTEVVQAATPSKAWWQVYLDNFLSGEKHEGNGGSMGVLLQNMAMSAWAKTGVLSAEDKQVFNSPNVVELGVRFDGKRGLLGASAARILTAIWLSVYLQRGRWSQKEAQVVLGRWIFILQFRRAAMGVLSRSWTAVSTIWPKLQAKNVLLKEIMVLSCLAPILQTDLTACFDKLVTCSDASETGGAAATSDTLSWSGRSLVNSRVDSRLQALELPILVISIFNGIGGAFRIYDLLGVIPMGRISVDISKPGNRVTRTCWPGVMELHDVEHIDKAEVKRWANLFPRVVEVHLFAGFPCVHLSAVRAFRQNLEGEGSRLFWKLLEIIQFVQDIFGVHCVVKFCVENVASMDESARRTISEYLDVIPIKLDPADILPYSRPRFAWCSEQLHSMPGVELWTEKEYVRAYLSSDVILEESQWIRPGWSWPQGDGNNKFPTFMKSIRRSRPPPFPAGLEKSSPEMISMWTGDNFRFPPYQYHPRFWLHQRGQHPRLLDSSEREMLLGFGPGHTDACQSASQKKKSLREHEDIRCSQCGDSFSIVPFAVMGAAMCSQFIPRMSPTQMVARMGLAPGASAHPSVRVPLTRRLSYGSEPPAYCDPAELVKYLGLSVNHTGSDVRVLTGQAMGHKTPTHASVRSWWWQWKQLFTVKWGESKHINF